MASETWAHPTHTLFPQCSGSQSVVLRLTGSAPSENSLDIQRFLYLETKSGAYIIKHIYQRFWPTSLHLCPTLCNPIDCSLPGSSVHGVFQARVWSGLLFPSPGDLPSSGIKPESLVSPALAGRYFYHCAICCKSVCLFVFVLIISFKVFFI